MFIYPRNFHWELTLRSLLTNTMHCLLFFNSKMFNLIWFQFERSFVLNFETLAPSLPRNSYPPFIQFSFKFWPSLVYSDPLFIRHLRVLNAKLEGIIFRGRHACLISFNSLTRLRTFCFIAGDKHKTDLQLRSGRFNLELSRIIYQMLHKCCEHVFRKHRTKCRF